MQSCRKQARQAGSSSAGRFTDLQASVFSQKPKNGCPFAPFSGPAGIHLFRLLPDLLAALTGYSAFAAARALTSAGIVVSKSTPYQGFAGFSSVTEMVSAV